MHISKFLAMAYLDMVFDHTLCCVDIFRSCSMSQKHKTKI